VNSCDFGRSTPVRQSAFRAQYALLADAGLHDASFSSQDASSALAPATLIAGGASVISRLAH
jgi:hypothetical protein